MKKILILFIICLANISANAQRFSTTDLFGNVSGGAGGNTGASLNYGSFTKTLAATDSISPAFFNSFYKCDTLRGAKTLTIKTKAAKMWDKAHLEFVADTLTAGRVVTFQTSSGNKVIVATTSSGNTVTVKKRKKVLITFRFDGDAWIEESRSIQF